MSPSAPAETATIQFNGLQIHTMAVGSGGPLLLIMGLGGNCDMWGPLLPFLRTRRVISFDAPGAGRSGTPAWPVSVPSLADLAIDVLRHWGEEAADVLGYSYGGAVAQQMAVQHPSTVRSLVLVATTMGTGSVAGSPAATRELGSPLRYYRPDLFKRTAATVYGGRVGRDARVRTKMALARSAHPPSTYGYALQLMGGWGWTSRPFAADIKQPTLIISGDDDPLVPVRNAQDLQEAIPGSELRVVSGGGHLLLLDEPQKTAGIIKRFLATSDERTPEGRRNAHRT